MSTTSVLQNSSSKLEPKATELAILMQRFPKGSEPYMKAMWDLYSLFVYDAFNNTELSNITGEEALPEEDVQEILSEEESPALACDKDSGGPTIRDSVLMIQAWNKMRRMGLKYNEYECQCAVEDFAEMHILGVGVKKSCVDNYLPEKGPFENYLRRSANRFFGKYFGKRLQQALLEDSMDSLEEDRADNRFADMAAIGTQAREIESVSLDAKIVQISHAYKRYFDAVNALDQGKTGNHLNTRKLLSYHLWFACSQFKTSTIADSSIIKAKEILHLAEHPEFSTYPSESKILAAQDSLDSADARNRYFFSRPSSQTEIIRLLWNQALIGVCEYQETDYQFVFDSNLCFLEVLQQRMINNDVHNEPYLNSPGEWESKMKPPSGCVGTILKRIEKLGLATALNDAVHEICEDH